MDKQINIVEILAEQCKNYTLYEGDTVSLNISIFDRQLKGVCFNNNIYFSVDELNYIMQKLISKEQECKELKKERKNLKWDLENNIQVKNHAMEEINQLKTENEELKNRVAELSLFQLYKIQRDKAEQTLTEIKEIIHFNKTNRLSGGACISIEQILQKISECEGNDGK
jgi:chromosome segregation ATPase